ncbi:MAG: hypothetical protein NUV97_01535 [archaeon]|nr:hypothetical protein [archaeon]MCR4323636.1 hypothetical protein [Nanoarchaeota archaeon]
MAKKNKNKKKNNNIILIIGILIILGIVIISILPKDSPITKPKELSEQEKLESWLSDNCECVERERLYCPNDNFKLSDGICISKGGYTNPSRGCSEYNCSKENYVFNFDKEEWGVEL